MHMPVKSADVFKPLRMTPANSEHRLMENCGSNFLSYIMSRLYLALIDYITETILKILYFALTISSLDGDERCANREIEALTSLPNLNKRFCMRISHSSNSNSIR